jgi:N-acyl amino acid synthase of PEP-CTERM/exosortase system
MSRRFRAVTLDGSPVMLEKSYRLRYQVYCIERGFLPAENYPNGLEIDEFDCDSAHVGVVDPDGELAGTARVVPAGPLGLPLFSHCTIFPHVSTLDDVGNLVVEVSRVSVSRHYSRRRDDPPFNAGVGDVENAVEAAVRSRQRRQHRAEPFITLLRAIVCAAKRLGATHLIGATDVALHRWLVHYGFPYRLAGPEVDYYGFIAPYIMSFADLDEVILSRQFAALDNFPIGANPRLWPLQDRYDDSMERTGANVFEAGAENLSAREETAP